MLKVHHMSMCVCMSVIYVYGMMLSITPGVLSRNMIGVRFCRGKSTTSCSLFSSPHVGGSYRLRSEGVIDFYQCPACWIFLEPLSHISLIPPVPRPTPKPPSPQTLCLPFPPLVHPHRLLCGVFNVAYQVAPVRLGWWAA